jgi:hypothetical protein
MTAPTRTQHDANVDRGVAFLDDVLGRDVWLRRVNLDRLDVASITSCVACQVTGIRWYGDALAALGMSGEALYLYNGLSGLGSGSWSEDHGFGLRDTAGESRKFQELNDAWQRRIRELRAER